MNDDTITTMFGRSMYWKMDPAGQVVPATRNEWAKLMNDEQARRIAEDTLSHDIYVSTVFVGIYDQFFETMVFGIDMVGEYQWRYDTIEEAREGHLRVVEAMRALHP